MDENLDDLGICVLSDECELIESTIQTMKYIFVGITSIVVLPIIFNYIVET